MLRGYIRTTKAGPSIERQRGMLLTAGIGESGPVFIDDRDAAIASLLSGDTLVVATAACLGTTASDVLTALAAIGAAGASVMDAEANERIIWHPDAQRVAEFANRADSQNRQAIAAKMRKARALSGHLGQEPIPWDKEKLSDLMDMLASGILTRKQMADSLGISRSTLQRKLRELRANRA